MTGMNRILGRVLVPVDESQTASRAIELGVALALRHGSELIFCTAVNHAAVIAECAVPQGVLDPTPVLAAVDDAARAILGEVAKRAENAGVSATTVLLDGSPASAIVEHARECAADAIVMGTQGKHGVERFFLGSTADGVLRSTHVPTFVVHPTGLREPPVFKTILAAVDESETCAAATAFALALARLEGARVVLCTAIATEQPSEDAARLLLDEAAQSASPLAVATDTTIARGEPVDALLRTAVQVEADLIAIGTHGRRGLRRLFLGSVAEGVVRRSPIPVVVVPPAS